MEVYIVVENGDVYPMTYKNYKGAAAAVKDKYKVYLENQIKELGSLEDIEKVLADVNVSENPEGKTQLYIEKGINIIIQKLPVSD